jgi:hypothetical protein
MFDTSASGIASLLAKGENSSVEFKLRPPLSRGTVGRYLSSFAHSGGGIVLFGVDNSGRIVGLTDTEEEVTLQRLRKIAASLLPPDAFRIGVVPIEDKRIVFVEVLPLPYVGRTSSFFKARLTRFLIETALILTIYSCVWYLSWLPATTDITIWRFVRSLYLRFSPPALLWTNLTFFLFFALVFYGTTFEVTPLRIVTAVFQPFVRLYLRRSVSKTLRTETIRPDKELIESLNEEDARPQEKEREIAEPKNIQLDDDSEAEEVVTSDDLFEEMGSRASFLANRMEKRTNTYMILGVAMGFLGMFFWFWTFNSALSKPMSFVEFIETAIPRVTILLFIELLAGFFLRQYRIGVEDFKYFFEIEQKANWKRISYTILSRAKNEPGLLNLASVLCNDSGPTKLAAGESTPALETLKAEGNVALEAMKLMSSTIQEVAKSVKPKN